MENHITLAILSALFLVSFALNISLRRGGIVQRIKTAPARGVVLWLFIAWFCATIAGAYLFITGAVDGEIYLSLLFAFGIAREFYSLGYAQAAKDPRHESSASQPDLVAG